MRVRVLMIVSLRRDLDPDVRILDSNLTEEVDKALHACYVRTQANTRYAVQP
jgi:hypothetical protein